MRLRYFEGIAAAALGAAAAFYLYVAWQLPVPRYTVASTPGFLPIVLGTIMLCLCVALLGKAVLARGGEADAPVEFSAIGVAKVAVRAAGAGRLRPPARHARLPDCLVPVPGGGDAAVRARPPWWMWLGVPAGLAIAAHIAFVVVLKLRLPSGLLPL